jgi:hypothetical protein
MTWRPLTPRPRLAPPAHRSFAGQPAGLFHSRGELSFVELVVLVPRRIFDVDVDVAHVLMLGLAGRDWTQRCAAESLCQMIQSARITNDCR